MKMDTPRRKKLHIFCTALTMAVMNVYLGHSGSFALPQNLAKNLTTNNSTEYKINLTNFNLDQQHSQDLDVDYRYSVEDGVSVKSFKNLTFVLAGSHLPTQDYYSDVDAFVKLYHKIGRDGPAIRFGTTGHVMNSQDPEWHKVFSFSWTEGTGQKWHFIVRDHDILERDDDVGEAVVDVDKYVAHGEDVNVSLSHGGFLLIKKTRPISFRIWAENIPNKDGENGKSDPYIEMFWRRGKNGTNIPFHTTPVLENDDNPEFGFEPIEFPNWQKGTDQYFFFQVYDKDTLSRDDFIGDFVLEIDPFVEKRVTQKSNLTNNDHQQDTAATLSIALV